MDALSKVLAIVTITGFAIQRALEILDRPICWVIKKVTGKDPAGGDAGAVSTKTWIMNLLAFGLGLLVVKLTGLSLLGLVDASWSGTGGDLLVSALVISAGTEGANIATKYLDYVKQGRKAALNPIEVSIIPSAVTVGKGSTFQFRATVKNTENKNVTWEVSHGAGGSITPAGLYTAPAQAGTYQVIALSRVDETKHAVATVTVQ